MVKKNTVIPKATAKRLPLYYRFFQNLSLSGKERVSSAEISEGLNIDSATIRRDLSYFGALGKKGYGYNVNYLVSFFAQLLHKNEGSSIALIGVGNLGTALINYNLRKDEKTKIKIAFDVDSNKIGKINDIDVYHLDQLEEKLISEKIEAVIMAVPAQFAQDVVDRLANTNVRGILNFSPVRLTAPKEIRVHYIDLTVELQALMYYLTNYK
ncbi:MAG: CoA-binding domain protein [Bacillales bacterium]|jgi:redox-sensing transcriptional repressor|nr:CoA-binding domain protein [Bacillales bacterium]